MKENKATNDGQRKISIMNGLLLWISETKEKRKKNGRSLSKQKNKDKI